MQEMYDTKTDMLRSFYNLSSRIGSGYCLIAIHPMAGKLNQPPKISNFMIFFTLRLQCSKLSSHYVTCQFGKCTVTNMPDL